MVVFAGLLLSTGWLGDRLGGKRVFQSGLVLFILASAACGFAPSLGVLIAARVAQGLGAALLVPSSLALLTAWRCCRRPVSSRSGPGWEAGSPAGAVRGSRTAPLFSPSDRALPRSSMPVLSYLDSPYSVASTMKSWPRPRSTRSAVRSCSPAWLACATRSRSNGSCRVSWGNS
jgi:MFS family permease